MFACEELETEQRLQYIDPYSYGHQCCVFLVILMLNRRPRGPLCWLSLLHLITNWSGPQTPSRVLRASSAGCGFPYHIFLQLVWSPTRWLPVFTELFNSSISQLNLWNGMFDRHRAEITVMQFRGHSLPVHQSMSVSWAFTLSHFISQICLHNFFRLLAIGMCHFLPVHHFGMACLAGSKVNIQHLDPYNCTNKLLDKNSYFKPYNFG